MSTRSLTTTSYAILGVLAMRPWSAYDLTGYMSTSAVRKLWPRTESRLYAEPKNLVAHGLASAKKEYTGKRKRTVYRITDAGRDALAEWLGEPSAPPQIEDEAMLRIFLGDCGSLGDLRATVRRAVERLRDEVETGREISDRVERGEPRFPDRIHVTAVTGTYAVRSMRQRFEQLRWVDEYIREWSDTEIDDAKRETAVAIHTERRVELEDLGREIEAFLGEG